MDALICAVVLSAVGPADIERPELPQTHMLLDGLTVLIPDGKDHLGIGFQRDMDSHQIPDANPQRRVHLIRVSIKLPPFWREAHQTNPVPLGVLPEHLQQGFDGRQLDAKRGVLQCERTETRQRDKYAKTLGNTGFY